MRSGRSSNIGFQKGVTMEIILTNSNFEQEVLSSDKPVLVPWRTYSVESIQSMVRV